MPTAPAAAGAAATRLATVPVSETPARKRVRISLGATTLVLAAIALLRVPYVGEVLDGLIADLLLFGTAKYAAYALAFAVGSLMCLPSRRRLRPVATKRFAVWSLAVLGLLAGVFAIVDFYARWRAGTDINAFLGGFFRRWVDNEWFRGGFVWSAPPSLSGGMWWALAAGVFAAAPAFALFLLLALILAGIVVALLFKFRVRGMERLRRKLVAWLGGHWRAQAAPAAVPPPPAPERAAAFAAEAAPPVPPTPAPTVSVPPAPTGSTGGRTGSQTGSRGRNETPFSVLFAGRRGRPYAGVVRGHTEDHREENRAAARAAAARLSRLFAARRVPGSAAGCRVGPARISLDWDLTDAPDAARAAAGLKREIAAAVGSPEFDAYLRAERIMEISFPAPRRCKIAFADVQRTLRPAADALNAAVGWNAECEPLALDLLAAGSTLVAGSQGSGRSMFLSSMLLSALLAHSPEQLLVGVVDTKATHLSRFEGVPHLVAPIPGDADAAYVFLDRVLHELKYRARLLRETGASTLAEYNAGGAHAPLKRFLLVINDVSDLMDANREYALRLFSALRSRGRVLGCAVVLASGTVAPMLAADAADAYSALVGFRADEPQCAARVCRDRLAKLYGQGEFLVFANGKDGLRETGSGQAAFVENRELRRLVSELAEEGA